MLRFPIPSYMLRTLGHLATKKNLPSASTLKALAFAAPFLLATASQADGLQLIHKWSDVQLYLKPKFNGISSWDQEFGIQATVLKKGNFAEQINFTYDPTYPVRWDKKPRFSLGFQSTYFFTKLPWKFGIYTKPKASPLPYTWKEETGLTWRLY